jgi:hypothetical protein
MQNITEETKETLRNLLCDYSDHFHGFPFRSHDAGEAYDLLFYYVKDEETALELAALFKAFDGEGVYQFVRKYEFMRPKPETSPMDIDSADWWKD